MGKKLNQYVTDYCLFDLETTGISINYDEVVEISAVKVRNGRIVDEFSTLVNPGRRIPPQASAVNGITDKMVEDAPDFETALDGFLTFAGNDVLVGHNIAAFDLKFISRDALKYWGLVIDNDYIDTLLLARKYLKELPGRSLTELAKHYSINPEGAHRALNDCRMNQQVFEHLREEIENAPEEPELKCPKCGSELKKRKGKFGEFMGCTGYPACRFTQNI